MLIREISVDSLVPGKQMVTHVYYSNYGKIPAYVSKMVFKEQVLNPGELPSYDYTGTSDVNNFFAAPDIEWEAKGKGKYIQEFDINEIKNKRQFIFVHGEILYKSIATDKTYLTKFCFELFPFENNYIRPHTDHNSTEEITK